MPGLLRTLAGRYIPIAETSDGQEVEAVPSRKEIQIPRRDGLPSRWPCAGTGKQRNT